MATFSNVGRVEVVRSNTGDSVDPFRPTRLAKNNFIRPLEGWGVCEGGSVFRTGKHACMAFLMHAYL